MLLLEGDSAGETSMMIMMLRKMIMNENDEGKTDEEKNMMIGESGMRNDKDMKQMFFIFHSYYDHFLYAGHLLYTIALFVKNKYIVLHNNT